MVRSIWKGPYVEEKTLDLIHRLRKTKPINTMDRKSNIVTSFLDRIFYIHNGHKYYRLQVNKEHLGFKLGHFSFTKKRCVYRNKKKSKKSR